MFMLDTNACIRILNSSSPPLIARLRQKNPRDIYINSVVKAELMYGAFHSLRVAENLRILGQFFEPFISLPLDDRCIENYGRLRSELTRSGNPIGPNDMLIAAITLTHGLILVTNNTREFSRVPGLQIENWES